MFYTDAAGHTRISWIDTDDVIAVPYDIPIPGYGVNNVNTLRFGRPGLLKSSISNILIMEIILVPVRIK